MKSKDNLNKYNSYLNSVYIDIRNSLFGHTNYTKFLIIGRSRTGSNFLRGLLNSHTQVSTYGEVFGNTNSLNWDHTGYFQEAETLYLLKYNPVSLIENKIYRKYPRRIKAVGFKLFYYHAQEPPLKSVWDHLHYNKDIKILHMKRNNYLSTHLSRKKAAITDYWVNTNGTVHPDAPVALDYQECLEDFIKTRNKEREFESYFRNHSKLDVIYEDLSYDYREVMKYVQEFLGVKIDEVQPVTYKQSILPLEKAIDNYFELKEKFSGSEWEVFFTE